MCDSLLSCGVGALGYMLEAAEGCAVSPQEEMHEEMEGVLGHWGAMGCSLPAVTRVDAGSLGR